MTITVFEDTTPGLYFVLPFLPSGDHTPDVQSRQGHSSDRPKISPTFTAEPEYESEGGTVNIVRSNTIENILYRVNNLIGSNQRDRILSLAAEAEEDVDQCKLSASSLLGYIAFLQNFEIKSDPLLGLAYDGIIYATWRNNAHHKFSIEIIDQKRLRYVAVYGENGVNDESGEKEISRMRGLVQETEIEVLLQSSS